eukprot:1153281-Pelagomonas_calceolata.AAC.4
MDHCWGGTRRQQNICHQVHGDKVGDALHCTHSSLIRNARFKGPYVYNILHVCNICMLSCWCTNLEKLILQRMNLNARRTDSSYMYEGSLFMHKPPPSLQTFRLKLCKLYLFLCLHACRRAHLLSNMSGSINQTFIMDLHGKIH